MVAIADTSTMNREQNHQTARIIQWLGGERAGGFLNKRIFCVFYFIKEILLFIYFS
jgi:hypothetical protein